MAEMRETEGYWGVICLHCGKPFPVPLPPAFSASQTTAEGASGARGLFLAWCPVCDREAPYSIAEMASFEASGARSSVPALEKAAGAP